MDDEDTVDIESTTLSWPKQTIDMSSSVTIPSGLWSTPTGNVTISTTSPSSYSIGASGSSGYMYTTVGSNGTSYSNAKSGLSVKGDAEFEGDVKIKGRSLEKLLQTIEDRLAILQEPDPKKLEKYVALKKAYDHYKTLERLIGED
jgi:hypothetical protein